MKKGKTKSGTLNTTEGKATFRFSGDGGPATAASLNIFPDVSWGIALDSAGSLYIADFENYRVRKVTGGIIGTVAGNGIASYQQGVSGPAISSPLSFVTGVAVDG